MASANHISYWNYLETVTANRNKEFENNRTNKVYEAQGLASVNSQVKLNDAQRLLIAANVVKTKADTVVSYAMAKKLAADTLVSKATVGKIQQEIAASKANVEINRGKLELDTKQFEFDMEKFAKEYIIAEKDVKIRQGNLDLGIAKLQQDFDIHQDKMTQEDKNRFQRYVTEVNDLVQSLTVQSNQRNMAKDQRKADQDLAVQKNATEIAKALLGIVDFF